MLSLENYILAKNINETFTELTDDTINEGIITNAIKKIWNWITGKPKKKEKDSYGGYSFGGHRYSSGRYDYDDDYESDKSFNYDKIKRSKEFTDLQKPIPKEGSKASYGYIIRESSINELKNIVAKNNNLESVSKLTDAESDKSHLKVNVVYDNKDVPHAVIVFEDITHSSKYLPVITDEKLKNNKYQVTKDNTIIILALEYNDSIKNATTVISELVLSCVKGHKKENIVVTAELSQSTVRYILRKLTFKNIRTNIGTIQFLNIAEMINKLFDE